MAQALALWRNTLIPSPSMAKNEQTLGAYLRDLRRKKTWSLLALSKDAGLNYQHLSRIENDSIVPAPETVVKLAESLGGDLNLMLELSACLPRQILDRLTARPATPALRRSASSGKTAPGSAPNTRAEALARSMGVPQSELADVAEAVVKLLSLDARRRQAVVQLMRMFDGGDSGGER